MLTSQVSGKVGYIYSAFGMTITSEIPLPELQSGSGPADIVIKIGKVPTCIDENAIGNEYYQAGRGQFLLHVKNVGSYYIGYGRQIIIEPAPNAEIKALHLFLLGSSMGALLLQRGYLPIHGSALAVGDSCFIITGSQGAGKSTLAAALMEREYAILTDDVAAIAFDETGIPWVYPSYPQQKLWRDSLELLGNSASSCANLYGRIDKFAVGIEDQFCAQPKKLTAIYELSKGNNCQVGIDRIDGLEKLALVMNNIYRLSYVHGLCLEKNIFKNAAVLAAQIRVSRISRPEGVFSLDDQILLLETHLREGACLP